MEINVPLISGLIGALIGAGTSIGTVIVQAHFHNKRERTKDAVGLALEDWKTRLAIVTQKGGTGLPLAVFVQYHTKLMELAENGQITPEAIRALNKEQEILIAAIQDMNDEIAGRRA